MAFGDLTNISVVAPWLNVTSDAEKAILSQLITSYSTWIQSWLSRNIPEQDYQDTFDGTGSNRLFMPQWPITYVSSVAIDGVSIPQAESATASGFRFSDTAIVLNGYKFSRGDANVQIDYTAGYDPIPADLSRACVDMVAIHYRAKDRIGVASKGLAGETIAYSLVDMPQQVKTILTQYRKTCPL